MSFLHRIPIGGRVRACESLGASHGWPDPYCGTVVSLQLGSDDGDALSVVRWDAGQTQSDLHVSWLVPLEPFFTREELIVEQRLASLLMREVLCEQIYQQRANWSAEHPNRSLGIRLISPASLDAHIVPLIGSLSPTALREYAAAVLALVKSEAP